MKVKQHTLQSFEFILTNEDNDKKVLDYISSKEPLLKNHMLIFNKNPLSENIKNFLDEKKLCYIIENCDLNKRKKSVKVLPIVSIEEAKKNLQNIEAEKLREDEKRNQTVREIFEKPIRSGEYIQSKNDIVILSQINSGAELDISGNLEIFGTVNGRVLCGGKYMIIRDIGSLGLIIFNGIILDKNKFKKKNAKLVKLDLHTKQLIVEEL